MLPSVSYRRSRDLKRLRSAINSRSEHLLFLFRRFWTFATSTGYCGVRRPRRTFVLKQARLTRPAKVSRPCFPVADTAPHSTVRQPAAVSTSGMIGPCLKRRASIECWRPCKRRAPNLLRSLELLWAALYIFFCCDLGDRGPAPFFVGAAPPPACPSRAEVILRLRDAGRPAHVQGRKGGLWKGTKVWGRSFVVTSACYVNRVRFI